MSKSPVLPFPPSNDCSTGQCSTGPSPFANQPPLGLSELPPDDPEDMLPDWRQVAPALPDDGYAVADALWWSHKLGQRQARGADVGYMLQTADDARAVQQALARAWGWWSADRVPTYWKSGGPALDQLIHAPLPTPGVHTAVDTAPAPATVFNLRGVEGEIALRMGQAVTAEQAASLTLDAALALVDGVAVAIEWVDVRWRDGLQAPALTLLADGQCHGGLAVGPWRDAALLQGRDWSQQTCTLQVGDAPTQTFTGSHSLGHPAALLVAWLQHVTQHYGTVPAGTVVTTGSWTGCPQAQAGDLVTVAFEGIGLVRWQF